MVRSCSALALVLLLAVSAHAAMSLVSGAGDANARWNAVVVGIGTLSTTPAAVGAYSDSSANWQAYGSLGELGFLPGANSSEAFGLVADAVTSNKYLAVGGCNNFGDNWQAFQCTFSGYTHTMTALPLPAGQAGSAAFGLSGDGSVIVGAAGSSDLFSVQPAKWTSAGTVASLLPLLPNTIEGQANSANLSGNLIVGDLYDESGGTHATKWINDVPMPLDLLAGSTFSQAYHISGDGSTIVGSNYDGSTYHATRWRYLAVSELPALPGSLGMVATACSDDGSFVVGYAIENGQNEAFIWDAAHGTRSMASFLSGEMHDNIDGFTFDRANDVVLTGNTLIIVGEGTYYGNVGWMAVETVPEPASLVLLVAGFALGLRRRK